MIAMKLENFDAVVKTLANLERKTVTKIVTPAIKAGRQNTLQYAKANAVTMVGGHMGFLIAKKLQIHKTLKRDLRNKKAIAYEVRIKPNVPEFDHYAMGSRYEFKTEGGRGKSRGRMIGKSYIPWAIEYGHVAPGQGGSNGPKVAAPIPYMRNAHLLTKQKSLAVAKSHIVAGIKREWNKAV